MSKLIDAFPALVNELAQSLRNIGRDALAEQIESATIARVTFDGHHNVGYIYLDPSRALNIVETNIIGVRHGETIPAKTSFWTVVDTDNFERVAGIEILSPGELAKELARRAVVR